MRFLADFMRSTLAHVQTLVGRGSPPAAHPVSPPAESSDGDAELFEEARALHQRGQLPQAEAMYRTLLEKHPGDFDLLYFLGMVLGQQGQYANATELIRRAIGIDTQNAAAHRILGNCLKGMNQHEAAISAYDAALALQPRDADTLTNRGATLMDLKRPSEALASYDRAISVNPDHLLAYSNRGSALQELHRPNDALPSYRKALTINPGYAPAHYGLALLLLEQNSLRDALEHLGHTLRFNPDHRAARSVMLYLTQKICRWDDFEANIRKLRLDAPASPLSAEKVVSPSIFMGLPGTTAEEQRQCAAQWVQFAFQNLDSQRNQLAFDHARRSSQKIKVGYLSADLREHAVARLMAQVFELHDRGRFDITAYSYGPDDGSKMRSRLQRGFDHFIDIREMSDLDAARCINTDQIDILVDLTGYTDKTRSGILALRPAPRQVLYLGYIGTMGADFVDYLIADPFMVPSQHRNYYAEKILYLPNCFQANDSTRPRPPAPTRAQCGLPEDAFVFCCFNQTYKITPEVFDTWCRLLGSVPGSVLWLFASVPDAVANLKHEAQTRGIDPIRLVMASEVPLEQYLARLQCADLYLDTIPYNAGTTCSDALWMGLPVLTCVGETLSSRMGGSLLSAIEVPELITYSLEDYHRLALELATNRTKLKQIREKIHTNRDTTPLFDCARFTHDLESAFMAIMNDSKTASHDAPAG